MSNSPDTFEKETDRPYLAMPAQLDDEYRVLDDHYRKRRWLFPTIMFVLTVLSTFWAGVTAWAPESIIAASWSTRSAMPIRQCLIANWDTGLIFSVSVLGILLAHEMGHYVMTRVYRVLSSYPIFIPFPFNAFGTCGAVIMMDGRSADRKEIFDIGIAGPLAGLVIAIPVAWIGMRMSAPPELTFEGSFKLGVPLLFQLLDMGTANFSSVEGISPKEASPLLMAAWIGLFVTGLNMLPMSQLDGGHVTFGLLGRLSHYVAYVVYGLCVIYVLVTGQYAFMLMLALILMLKLRHPPSRNDHVQIGLARSLLAVLSLSLPLLCIPAKPLIF